MNAENFADIIRNPAQLYQLSYQELKSLVLQYPYCRNLHHLLLQKSHLDQHRDFENALEKTAMYSIDRRYLYRQLRALRSEPAEVEPSFEMGTDFLELHDLSTFGPRREPIPLEIDNDTIPSDISGSDNGFPASPPTPPPPEREEGSDDFANLEEALQTVSPSLKQRQAGAGESARPVPFLADSALLAACGAWLGILEQTHFSKSAADVPPPTAPAPAMTGEVRLPDPVRPQPKPKSSFTSWVRQYQPEHVQPHLDSLLEADRKKGKKKKKPKTDRIIEFAEQSLRMNEEVVSETLAELFVQQERYDRAIRMYERLILIFPEKSSYFASKIEQLKKYN